MSVTPLSFDIAGLELYLPLLVGGTIVWRIAHKPWMERGDEAAG